MFRTTIAGRLGEPAGCPPFDKENPNAPGGSFELMTSAGMFRDRRVCRVRETEAIVREDPRR